MLCCVTVVTGTIVVDIRLLVLPDPEENTGEGVNEGELPVDGGGLVGGVVLRLGAGPVVVIAVVEGSSGSCRGW